MEKMTELIKSLVSPTEKLLEDIKCAIGKAYEPHHIKRMADAHAYEITKMSEAMREASDIPIEYQQDALSLSTVDEEAFYRRTQNRLNYQELRKQQNIESIIGKTYTMLSDVPPVENVSADPDWMLRFFHAVENISNEQMQLLWSKLLANEIRRSNSFSLRTLDVLKNMSASEAKLFSEIAPLVLKCYADKKKSYFDFFLPCIFSNESTSSGYGLSFAELYPLCDAGILSNNSGLVTSLYIQAGGYEYIEGEGKSIKIINRRSELLKVVFPIYLLTTAGIELLPVVMASHKGAPSNYFDVVGSALKESHDYIDLIVEDNSMK